MTGFVLHCFQVKFCKGSFIQTGAAILNFLGRGLDLTAKCKQLAVDPSQTTIRALVAHNPDVQSPAFFVFNALPFGATGSVYGFNRVAKVCGFG